MSWRSVREWLVWCFDNSEFVFLCFLGAFFVGLTIFCLIGWICGWELPL
ncbi:MAG: hypothetical protein ACYSW8_32735 [Planctomycetota bacterium]|jgi:hypothetical protein